MHEAGILTSFITLKLLQKSHHIIHILIVFGYWILKPMCFSWLLIMAYNKCCWCYIYSKKKMKSFRLSLKIMFSLVQRLFWKFEIRLMMCVKNLTSRDCEVRSETCIGLIEPENARLRCAFDHFSHGTHACVRPSRVGHAYPPLKNTNTALQCTCREYCSALCTFRDPVYNDFGFIWILKINILIF